MSAAVNLGSMERAEAEAFYDSGGDACVKVLLALANQVERLEGRVERLEGEVRELRRGSDNSSLPPSADPGAGKNRGKGKRSGRKASAQPGHPGSGRRLLPIEQVDEVIEHLPASCGECGRSLEGEPGRGPVRRHQIAELPEVVRGSPVLCVDETGCKQAGERRFLWGAFTEEAAVIRVAASRHREEAEELLAGSEAIVSSDRWWAYDYLDPARRQVCWSHLLRDFRFHAESPLAQQSESGGACLRVAEGVSEAWRKFQADNDRRRLRREIAPLQRELRALREAGKRKSTRTRFHRGLARNLIKLWPALWTFIKREGVKPTNNRTERGLPHAVINRKPSQGNRSQQRALATERLLSATTTYRLQRRSLFTNPR